MSTLRRNLISESLAAAAAYFSPRGYLGRGRGWLDFLVYFRILVEEVWIHRSVPGVSRSVSSVSWWQRKVG